MTGSEASFPMHTVIGLNGPPPVLHCPRNDFVQGVPESPSAASGLNVPD